MEEKKESTISEVVEESQKETEKETKESPRTDSEEKAERGSGTDSEEEAEKGSGTDSEEKAEKGSRTEGKARRKDRKKAGREEKKPVQLKVWKIVLILVLLFVVTFFTSAVLWALYTWSLLTMDELLWHLKVSMKGTNMDMVVEFLLVTLISSFLITGIMAFFLIRSRRKKKATRRTWRFSLVVTGLVLLVGLVSAWKGFSIGSFLKSYMTVSSFIEDEYVDPGTVKLTFPEKKRNVIVIYLESMELTYMDPAHGGAFPENLIDKLTVLGTEYEDFSGYSGTRNGGVALPGAVWTMGAMFGTSTGLPLKTPLGQNGMSVNDDFLPGIITLGDILQSEGYTNYLLLGSDATFGGRRLYYETHGDYVIHDYVYAKEVGRIPENYKVWWGYEDQKLFEYAKEELTELSKKDEPFNYTMLTVDTHFEDGHFCPLCTRKFGSNKYANIMDCSSTMVYNFVRWIQKQDFYENTTIIITGDHPTMDRDFCNDVPEDYLRKTYTCIINPAAKAADPTRRRDFTTFDLFPTTLAAMGVSIEGDRLGLGTNLYSDKDTQLERYGLEKLEEDISARSKLMERMYKGTYISPGKGKKEEE